MVDTQVRGGAVRPDFESNGEFEFRGWTDYTTRERTWFALREDGRDLARAEIDEWSFTGVAYGVRAPQEGFVEIRLLEVAIPVRRSSLNLGLRTVSLLREFYRSRHFCALSSVPDFWDAAGGVQHTHPDGLRFNSLFTFEAAR